MVSYSSLVLLPVARICLSRVIFVLSMILLNHAVFILPSFCCLIISLDLYLFQAVAPHGIYIMTTSPPVGSRTWRSIAISMSVCVFACLFVRSLAYLKNHTSKFNQIFCAYYMWPWLDPPLTAMLHMRTCTSGFVNDVVFSHNGANGPQSKTTKIKDNAYVSSSSPATAPGAKSAVSDYILC